MSLAVFSGARETMGDAISPRRVPMPFAGPPANRVGGCADSRSPSWATCDHPRPGASAGRASGCLMCRSISGTPAPSRTAPDAELISLTVRPDGPESTRDGSYPAGAAQRRAK